MIIIPYENCGLEMEEAMEKVTHTKFYDEVKKLTGRIGYIYPEGEQGYYRHSNLGKTVCVQCLDGYYYAEIED